MNGHQRNKAGLLSRVSSIAIIAAAGTFGATQQAQADCGGLAGTFDVPAEGTTISGTTTCVTVSANVPGNVVNGALVGDPGAGYIPFDVYNDIVGRLTNNGNIFGGYGQDGALTIRQDATITNGILNNGVITSTTGNGIQIGDGSEGGDGYIQNGITNTNNITSGSGNGIAALYGTLTGGLTNQFDNQASTISGGAAAIYIADTFTSWNGGIHNYGQVSGANAAIRMGDGGNNGAVTFGGGIVNYSSGVIDSANGAAVVITNDVNAFTGGITNHGVIEGGDDAIIITADTFGGGVTNTGNIIAQGEFGDAIYVDTAWSGNFNNSGLIQGGDSGFEFAGTTYVGDFINSDRIFGGKNGFAFSGTSFIGDFTNSDIIFGGKNGVEFSNSALTIGSALNPADFVNSGSIEGEFGAGLSIYANAFTGTITNQAGGVISGGETGAYVETATFTGLIQNNGTITGNADTTGLHIVTTGTHTGNIVNNGLLSAPSNALHVEINTLVGTVTNTGTIEAGIGATAVLLDINVVNNGSNPTFVNSDEGFIDGNLLLGGGTYGGEASLTFRAENGTIAGNIVGLGVGAVNNDYVDVRGMHYFVDGGGENGTASNLAAFNVNSGGTAVMGALSVGASSGSGYSFFNVDNLNVNNGGTLYIDKSTQLNVDVGYTQQSGGTTMFYLDAPNSSATGIVTGYAGQIDVNGTATLSGTIAGYLDPDFASAHADLTEVRYNDVIVANAIVGNFTDTDLFSHSAIWQMQHLIDGNTVDLRVTRTPLDHLGGLSNIVVETAGPWKSMVNDRSNGIGSGSCGLAGEGWCLNRFAANETGATQVMNDASPGADPFDWLRTGVRKVGETAAWGRVVGVWGETEGELGNGGTDFQTTGAIVGVDHVFSQVLLAGVAAQWTASDVDFDGRRDNADIGSFEAGAYMSYGDARLYVNANASFIWHDFEVNRFIGADTARGDYNGTTISGYLEAGKIFETYEGLRIQPLVGISYAHLETDAYGETGTAATLLNVFDSDFDSLKGNLGARFAYPFQMESGRKWVPEARIVWAHEFMDDQSSFWATIQGDPTPVPQLVEGQEYSRDTLVLGAGLTAPLSSDATLFFDYDAGLNEDVTAHTLSAGLRMKW